ncbi:MAG: GNAT family N-acetyltransferase [bacterium]|nr:GNAT family N-acetyltransferase [bacterium]
MEVGIQATTPADWPALVAADPAADYFHTAAWSSIVARHVPGARALWITVRDAGELVGGLAAVALGGTVRRCHSGAFGCAGGPLVADGDARRGPVIAGHLLDELVGRRGGLLASVGVSLNPDHEERWGGRLAADARFRRVDTPAAVVSLDGGPDAVAARMRKSKRNERNRGLRRGAEFLVTRDPDHLAAYHRIHVQAAGAWGQPAVPLAMLQDLLDQGAGPEGGEAYFVAVRCEGRIVGGHLNFHLGGSVTAWHGVTDPVLARTHFPSTVAVWGDAVEACRRGATSLDLGGSGGIPSLESFKRGFGAERRERGWYVAETAPLRLLRSLRGLVRRKEGNGRRWHDGATGASGGGTP